MKKFFLAFLVVFIASASAQRINTGLTYSVNLPAKLDGKNPVLIMLHGYGSNEADLFELAKAFESNVITFSLRAPIDLHTGYCWYHLEFDDKGIKKYNYQEAAKSREMILNFISELRKVYKLDSSKVFLLGFSQGAIMSYDLLLNHPEKITGIVALSGRLMDETAKIKSKSAVLASKPVFIGHGYSDNVIAFTEAEKAKNFLTISGCKKITFRPYQMPHSINGAELNDIKAWMKQNQN